jgi:glyoxylase I family protein
VQKVTGIGGVFFRARDPKELTSWYEKHLGIDITEKTWTQRAGLTVFSPFKRDTDYFGRSEQQWMICFRVEDLIAFVAQLTASGIDVIQNDDWNSEVGTFARIHDPEGNPIELWEPSEQSRGENSAN